MNVEAAIESLRVRAGDPITAELWNAMVDLHEELVDSYGKVNSGQGVRISKYPQGMTIVADGGRATFGGSFKVRLSGENEVTIGAGTVNNRTPTIYGKPIDGIDEAGKQGELPKLKVSPGETNRSWVCVKVTVDPESKPPAIDPDDPDALIVEHITDETRIRAQQAEGLHVLALLVWRDKTATPHQVVFFDQQHSATKDAQGHITHYFSQAS